MTNLLVDEDEARLFCRQFLLPYKKMRLLHCVARQKYSDGALGQTHIILERGALYCDREERSEDIFIDRLRRYEALAAAGLYKDEKKEGQVIKKDWMAAYVTAYPHDVDDGCDEFFAHVMEQRKQRRRQMEKNATSGDATVEPSVARPVSLLETYIHKSPCRKNRMLKLDVDTKDPALLADLQSAMRGCKVLVAMETRGGFHVVVERGASNQNLWKFQREVNSTIAHADQWITIENGNGPLLAIPGTNQGGFTVRLATKEWTDALEATAEEP